MTENMSRKQPFKSDSLQMQVIPATAMVRVHSLHDLQQLITIQLKLPEKTGQCCGSDPAALCLRPNEWLIVSETTDSKDLLQQVQFNVDLQNTSVFDNSDGLCVIRLSGRGAAWLLSKLSGLDYLAGTATGSHCARTKIGHVTAVVYFHQANGSSFVFDLIFDRSVEKYLWDLLSESAPHADDLAHAFGDAA